jgi:adenosylcobyric acid synthase
MMLSRSIEDPHGVEGGAPGSYRGLGLVDSTTTMGVTKRTVRTVVEALGSVFDGYEIRYGELAGGERFVTNGRVMATTVHGLFEHSGFIERLLGVPAVPVLEPTFELLADAIEEHLDTDLLRRLIG